MIRRIIKNSFKKNSLRRQARKYAWEVGRHTYGEPVVIGANEAHLSIGNFTSIANEVTIFLGHEHRVDWISTFPFPAFSQTFPGATEIKGHPMTKGDVEIGHDVWIGHGATIMSGVRIGHGAVIGARALVTKDIPEYAIAVGVPAKVTAYRFTPDQINSILSTNWWDWDDEVIDRASNLICSKNISEFLTFASNHKN